MSRLQLPKGFQDACWKFASLALVVSDARMTAEERVSGIPVIYALFHHVAKPGVKAIRSSSVYRISAISIQMEEITELASNFPAKIDGTEAAPAISFVMALIMMRSDELMAVVLNAVDLELTAVQTALLSVLSKLVRFSTKERVDLAAACITMLEWMDDRMANRVLQWIRLFEKLAAL